MGRLVRGARDVLDTLEFIGFLLCAPIAVYVAWRVHPYLSAASVLLMGMGLILLARARDSRAGAVGAGVVGLVGLGWLVYLVVFCAC